MRALSFALLALAGAVLLWIGLRAPEPDYAPLPTEPTGEEVRVPLAIIGVRPAGHVVRTFDVGGMCCNGCSGKLYAALKSVPGVVEAAVDFGAGTASALVPDSMDVSLLSASLHFDKYSARARESSPN